MSKKFGWIKCIIWFFLGIKFVFSQDFRINNARSLGVAGAHHGFLDVWTVYHQPAYLAFLPVKSIGVNYTNFYLLPEFSTLSLAGALPFLKQHAVGLGYNFEGYSKHQQHHFVFGYGLQLSPQWALGLQPSYRFFQFADKEFGAQHGFDLSVSSKVFVLPVLSLSVVIREFYQTNFVTHVFPAIFEVGLAYQILNNLLWNLQIEKGLETEFSCKTGLEYVIGEKIFLRLGAGYQPILFGLGVGTVWKKIFHLEVATAYHWHLGFIPSISWVVDL